MYKKLMISYYFTFSLQTKAESYSEWQSYVIRCTEAIFQFITSMQCRCGLLTVTRYDTFRLDSCSASMRVGVIQKN